MFEIIILFVIISVISNIIKAVNRQSPQQMGSPTTGAPATPKEIVVQRDRMEQKKSKYTTRIEQPTFVDPTSQQIETKTISEQKAIPKQSAQPRTTPEGVPQPNISLSNLTRNRLVEGIILSEVLSPPRSRRQRIG